MIRRRPRTRRTSPTSRAYTVAVVLAIAATAAPALAVECNLDVLAAHETAKARGWQFNCPAAPGFLARGFVTYPPSSIGCTFKTGAVVPPALSGSLSPGGMQLFGAQLGVPLLKNGWQFVRYEITGGSYQIMPPTTAIVAAAPKIDKANHTYNFKLTALVLKKDGGQCSQAINQAF
jgi:hypothetical protein